MNNFPTAGIIVIKQDQTILVQTHRGHLSFPKGSKDNIDIETGKKVYQITKTNKTKTRRETDFECACRELYEETGLSHDKLRIVPNITLDEMSNKGHPAVRYFIGVLDGDFNDFKFDGDELLSVKWYKITDALNMPDDKLKSQRRDVLEQAIKFV